MKSDLFYMKIALEEAVKGAKNGEVPVGAVLVDSFGVVVAKAYNQVEHFGNPLLHSEILVITEGCKKFGKFLGGFKIYVSKEPCSMCATAISYARISEVVFALEDAKGGAILNGVKLYDNQKNLFIPKVSSGLLSDESLGLLQSFFRSKRTRNIKV